jgi:hypothetical protein
MRDSVIGFRSPNLQSVVMYEGEIKEVNRGLVSFWPMDETGTTLKDQVGTNDMTLTGTITNASGPGNGIGAVQNLEADAEGTVTADSSIDIASGTEYTVYTWINPLSSGGDGSSGDNGTILNKTGGASTVGYGWRVSFESGTPTKVQLKFDVFLTTTDMAAYTGNIVPLNEWGCAAATYNEDGDNKGKVYWNGAIQSLNTDTAGAGSLDDDSANDLLIGNQNTSVWRFDGKIAGIRIYNVALTASEISQQYMYDLRKFYG